MMPHERYMRLLASLVVGLSISLTSIAALAEGGDPLKGAISFPGKRDHVRSPSGHYALRLEREQLEDGYYVYRLFLKDLQTSQEQRITEFLRSVDVLWRPGAEGFFADDWQGSNASDCLVADLIKWQPLTSMTDVINQHPELDIKEDARASHYYVSCQEWLGPDQLQVMVSGHTDEANSHEFSYSLVYDLKSKLIRRR